jgi:hypothetical protein
MTKDIHCDFAIIGGGLGGCAAAKLRIEPPVFSFIITEKTDWLGGQITSQGVSALDEHAHVEHFGGTRYYKRFRSEVRWRYQMDGAPEIMHESVLGPEMPLNPGNGWVSRLCFLPERAVEILHGYIAPTDRLLNAEPIAADVENGVLKSVTVQQDDGEQYRIHAKYFLDATELGDLLPLTGTPYVTGAESRADTGEPDAPDTARSGEVQGFTFPLAVEYRPGEDHTIEKPAGYETFRDEQPYTLSPIGRDGQPVIYRMFIESEQGNPPFWTYRRIHDGTLLGGNDISMINWGSNDYHGGDIIDATTEDKARYLDEAKRLSLGFLYWLQTECPRDEGGYGYHELKLRPDVMGTEDGLSKAPYIRESRRIVPLKRIVQQDISADFNDGARARNFTDSVGLGWYPMDLHPCVGNPDVSMYAPTRPFQIPLGALISPHTHNLIAACKNIGTTHLTNGSYRLHPVEWSIGEAALHLALFCIQNDLTPQAVHADPWLTWRLQAHLVRAGCPTFWVLDAADETRLATQLLLVRGVIVPGSDRWYSLEISPHEPLGDSIDLHKLREIAEECNQRIPGTKIDTTQITKDATWAAICDLFRPTLLEFA